MSTPIERILNGNGPKVFRRDGSAERLHSEWITHEGVSMQIEYRVDGHYLAATATDPECTPVCEPVHIKVGGTDILPLLSENLVSTLAEKVETRWRMP